MVLGVGAGMLGCVREQGIANRAWPPEELWPAAMSGDAEEGSLRALAGEPTDAP